jgi:short-subunit dehydrogenase
VIPYLIKQKGGQIVGVTSLIATLYRCSYSRTKHAFVCILDSLRSELKPFDIGVCYLMHGYTKTNVAKNYLAGAHMMRKFAKINHNIKNYMSPVLFAKNVVELFSNSPLLAPAL